MAYRYVRVVGTHNTVNKVFHLVALECMFTQRTYVLAKGLLGKEFVSLKTNFMNDVMHSQDSWQGIVCVIKIK